jgi:hypothetical protein
VPGPADATAPGGSLAARQQALVAALVAGAPPPAGLSPERVRLQALALLRKRSRIAARHRPELAAQLGDAYWTAFQRYAATRPGPPPSPHADAKAFARHIRAARFRALFHPSRLPRP